MVLLRLRVVNIYTLAPGDEFYALFLGHRMVNFTLLLRAPAPGCDSYALVSGDDFYALAPAPGGEFSAPCSLLRLQVVNFTLSFRAPAPGDVFDALAPAPVLRRRLVNFTLLLRL